MVPDVNAFESVHRDMTELHHHSRDMEVKVKNLQEENRRLEDKCRSIEADAAKMQHSHDEDMRLAIEVQQQSEDAVQKLVSELEKVQRDNMELTVQLENSTAACQNAEQSQTELEALKKTIQDLQKRNLEVTAAFENAHSIAEALQDEIDAGSEKAPRENRVERDFTFAPPVSTDIIVSSRIENKQVARGVPESLAGLQKRAEVDRVRADSERARATELQAELRLLQTKLAETNSARRQDRELLADLRKEKARATEKFEKLEHGETKEVEALRATLQAREAAIASREQALVRRDDEISSCSQKIHHQESECRELQHKLEETNQRRQDLHREVEDRERQLREVSSDLQLRDAHAHERLLEAQTMISELNLSLSASESSIEQGLLREERMQKQLETYREQLQNFGVESGRLTEELAARELALENAGSTIEDAEESLRKLMDTQVELAELHERVRQLQQDNEGKATRIVDLEQKEAELGVALIDIQSLRQHADTSQQLISEREAELGRAGEVSRLAGEMATQLEVKINNLYTQMQMKDQSIEDLERQLAARISKLADVEEEAAKQRNEASATQKEMMAEHAQAESNMAAENAHLTQQLRAAESAISKHSAELQEVTWRATAQLRDAEVVNDSLDEELQQLRDRYEKELEEMKAESAKAEEQQKATLERLETTAKGDRAQLQSQVAILEEELQKEQAKFAALREQLAHHEETSSRLSAQLGDAEMAVAAQQRQFGEEEMRLNGKIAEFDRQCQQLDEQMCVVLSERHELEQKHTKEVERLAADKKSELEVLETRMLQKEGVVHDLKREMEETHGRLKSSRGQVDQLRSQLVDRDGNLTALESRVADLKGELAVRESTIREQTQQFEQAKTKFEEEREELKKRNAVDLAQSSSSMEQLQGKLQTMENSLLEHTGLQQQLQEKLLSATMEQKQLQEKLSEEKANSGELQSSLQSVSTMNAHLSRENDDLKMKLVDSQQHEELFKRSKAEAANAQSQLLEKVSQVQALEQSLSGLKRELGEMHADHTALSVKNAELKMTSESLVTSQDKLTQQLHEQGMEMDESRHHAAKRERELICEVQLHRNAAEQHLESVRAKDLELADRNHAYNLLMDEKERQAKQLVEDREYEVKQAVQAAQGIESHAMHLEEALERAHVDAAEKDTQMTEIQKKMEKLRGESESMNENLLQRIEEIAALKTELQGSQDTLRKALHEKEVALSKQRTKAQEELDQKQAQCVELEQQVGGCKERIDELERDSQFFLGEMKEATKAADLTIEELRNEIAKRDRMLREVYTPNYPVNNERPLRLEGQENYPRHQRLKKFGNCWYTQYMQKYTSADHETAAHGLYMYCLGRLDTQ
eukprot:gene4673-5721_t